MGRDDSGRVVFAAGGLAGEEVVVELTAEKKSFARGRVIDVVRASPDRTTPACPTHAAGCGGCDLAHANAPAQTRIKRHVVRDALTRIGRLEPDVVDAALALGDEVEHTPIPARYRTTVRLAVHEGRVGYRKRASHAILHPEQCTVVHPHLEQLMRAVRVSPDGGSELIVRVSAHSGQAVIATDGEPAGVSTGSVDAEVVRRSDVASGRLTEFAGGRTFQVSAQSFFQAGPDVATALVDAVAAAAGPLAGLRVVDAYAGVGLFAGSLGHACDSIVAIEQSASATEDARVNLADLDCKIIEGSVDRWHASPADLVIADPSRAGLRAAGVDALVATGAGIFVLVACDSGSLGRDVGLLSGAGYRLESVQLVDAFHDTSHVETVVRLRK